MWGRLAKAGTTDSGLLRLQAVILFQNTIRLLHSRVIFREGLDVGAELAVNLAVLKRRFSAKSRRNNVFKNNIAGTNLSRAGLAEWNAVSTAPRKRGLADLLRKLPALLTSEVHATSALIVVRAPSDGSMTSVRSMRSGLPRWL